MNKIIAYGISDNGERVWMGRPTLLSWLYCFFKRGGMLRIRPIPGYEEYAYYPNQLFTVLNTAILPMRIWVALPWHLSSSQKNTRAELCSLQSPGTKRSLTLTKFEIGG